VVEGVTFPLPQTGQIIYVTAYGAACPVPLATASFNTWYYQPLIVGDTHLSLAQAISDYSIFLGMLAPGSYATLDGNVVSVYINRDGWRFGRRGFSNPDVCFANFGFCGFNDAGFDPPTFDIRVINRIECCDFDFCNMSNYMLINDIVGKHDFFQGFGTCHDNFTRAENTDRHLFHVTSRLEFYFDSRVPVRVKTDIEYWLLTKMV
jgi:hypothetical protein